MKLKYYLYWSGIEPIISLKMESKLVKTNKYNSCLVISNSSIKIIKNIANYDKIVIMDCINLMEIINVTCNEIIIRNCKNLTSIDTCAKHTEILQCPKLLYKLTTKQSNKYNHQSEAINWFANLIKS